MGAARDLDQADFDLERFINMFDEAMTSKDPRVIETLRSLMMIVTLTRPESTNAFDTKKGPLRRAFEDMNHLWKRFEQMEEELRQMHQRMSHATGPQPRTEDKYTMAAASQMARHMDDSLLQELSKNTATAINGGLVPQNLKLSTKGLLKK